MLWRGTTDGNEELRRRYWKKIDEEGKKGIV